MNVGHENIDKGMISERRTWKHGQGQWTSNVKTLLYIYVRVCVYLE